jgi:transposase-like protein
MKIYPDEFKSEVAKKHLLPGGKSVAVLSKEVGVSEQSIRNWIYKFSNGITVNNNSDFNLLKTSDSDKLNLLFESKTMPDDKKGIWLREKGLKTEHIKLWEEQLKDKLNDKDIKLREENKKLKEEVKSLQTELQRKEKALAEMSSLLMLKKNYRSLILGEED